MAISDERTTQALITFAIILFALYFFGGYIDIIGSLGLIVVPLFIPDLTRGIIVVIVSMVFLTATRELLKDVNEGYAFILIGAMLGFLLFLLETISLASHALGWILRLEDWVDWTIASDLGPPILMFPITLPLFFMHHKRSKKPKRHLRRKHKEEVRHGNP